MSPIRVGLIGLSSATGEASASPGDGWAASAHLPYLLKSPHYEITALCNSSIKSAKAAVEKYGLPKGTATYGSSSELAEDPNVDLVVCSVRVDRHHALMLPVLQKGKNAFIEWPLGSSLAEAEDLAAAAKASGAKTIVGLQARVSPEVQNIKRLVSSGAIGDLISTTMRIQAAHFADTEPSGYSAKKEVGANVFRILFAHIADPLFYALGQPEEISTILRTRWPRPKLLNADGSLGRVVDRTSPDHAFFQGTLKGSGAPVSITVRGGKGFKDTPAYEWRIFGTAGEIRFTAPAPPSLSLDGGVLQLYKHKEDSIETLESKHPEAVEGIGPFAKNIGQIYEIFATGEGEGLADFEDALRLHRTLAAMEESSETKKFTKGE